MMKLFLTSYRIPDPTALSELLGKPLAGVKVALIPNAKDYYAARARGVKTRNVATYLQSFGMEVTIADLNEMNSPAVLLAELTKYDMLWVMGGNTFCLREAMRSSGFDQAIRDILGQGVVYAGESAGACVAGTDLHGLENKNIDDPEFAETVIWEGLALTPYFILPHADNVDYGPVAQTVIANRPTSPEIVALDDNQAWVVNGDEARKITGVKPGPQQA